MNGCMRVVLRKRVERHLGIVLEFVMVGGMMFSNNHSHVSHYLIIRS
jgi:hypothetical protein